jgi:hypothetical protein
MFGRATGAGHSHKRGAVPGPPTRSAGRARWQAPGWLVAVEVGATIELAVGVDRRRQAREVDVIEQTAGGASAHASLREGATDEDYRRGRQAPWMIAPGTQISDGTLTVNYDGVVDPEWLDAANDTATAWGGEAAARPGTPSSSGATTSPVSASGQRPTFPSCVITSPT